MKKGIKICIGIILAVVLLLSVVVITKTGGAEITEGTYKITDYAAYPDAYIVVKENKLQFYNIDLNAIYQEAQLEDYKEMQEHGLEFHITEQQLGKISDLNELFVSNPYELDYESSTKDNKTGTFTYVYFCYNGDYPFGLVLEYNSLHKTVKINSPEQTLIFEK